MLKPSLQKTTMDPVSEILAFDLLDFDMKHVFFPTNSCDFIIEMAGIQVPKGQIAEFNESYQSRIGPLNDFEKVTFYSDFTRLIGNTILTPSMQEQVRQFFQICFVEDMTSIDLLCAEVFLQPNPATMTPPSDKQTMMNCNKKD